MQARHAFLEAGAKDSRCFECPNNSPEWLAALADLSVLQMGDRPTAPAAASAEQIAASRATAWRWLPGSRLDRVFICSCFNSCLRPFCLG